MALIIDLIIVAIILLFTFLGYKRGLIKVAIKLCTFFIAIIIAFILYKPIANVVIKNTEIDNKIENAITKKILPEGASEDDDVELSQKLPKIILKNSENTVQSIATACSRTLIETACLLLIFSICINLLLISANKILATLKFTTSETELSLIISM